ncbi:MAG TPA: helix-turn-helix transcriptional regulator [Flavobacterium sp.]|nr:helix-turn-helix transcriptional regulator [Flavobacterium sp.]
MRFHEKIKLIRESKKLSQSYLAYELNLDQSQYSRREKGEIQFVSDEIVKLSKLLETSISELFGEEVIESQKIKKIEENLSIAEKLIEQYELRIKEKEEMIVVLKKLNEKQTNR